MQCEAGKASATLAATSAAACVECVAGKFSDTTGVAACKSCTAGSYMSTAGASSCEQVSVEGGETRAETMCRSLTSSFQCDAGKASGTQAATSAAVCTECGAGKTSSEDRSDN